MWCFMLLGGGFSQQHIKSRKSDQVESLSGIDQLNNILPTHNWSLPVEIWLVEYDILIIYHSHTVAAKIKTFKIILQSLRNTVCAHRHKKLRKHLAYECRSQRYIASWESHQVRWDLERENSIRKDLANLHGLGKWRQCLRNIDLVQYTGRVLICAIDM